MVNEEELKEEGNIKKFTGIADKDFWEIMEELEERFNEYEQNRLENEKRERGYGGGPKYKMSLVMRVVMLLTYLRWYNTQEQIAMLFGGTQSMISRDLRRLLPLLKEVLPIPEVWEVVESEEKPKLTEEDKVELEEMGGKVLIDAFEQPVNRPKNSKGGEPYYSGKKKTCTVKTQMVTDEEHHIEAISEVVPGSKHDKKLCEEVQTLERIPDGSEGIGDKGYQGLDKEIEKVEVIDVETGEVREVPRIVITTPKKKLKGGELTASEKAFNRAIGRIRVRIEHCIGWVKNWKIVREKYRCAKSIYISILQVVCGFVNAQTLCWQTAKLGKLEVELA